MEESTQEEWSTEESGSKNGYALKKDAQVVGLIYGYIAAKEISTKLNWHETKVMPMCKYPFQESGACRQRDHQLKLIEEPPKGESQENYNRLFDMVEAWQEISSRPELLLEQMLKEFTITRKQAKV